MTACRTTSPADGGECARYREPMTNPPDAGTQPGQHRTGLGDLPDETPQVLSRALSLGFSQGFGGPVVMLPDLVHVGDHPGMEAEPRVAVGGVAKARPWRGRGVLPRPPEFAVTRSEIQLR